jgi:F0F1-type ATP synthase membrane subunit c/vacuolar-type H+-ATPase subunit K
LNTVTAIGKTAAVASAAAVAGAAGAVAAVAVAATGGDVIDGVDESARMEKKSVSLCFVRRSRDVIII